MWGGNALRIHTSSPAEFGTNLVDSGAMSISNYPSRYGRPMLELRHPSWPAPVVIEAEALERVVRAARILATTDEVNRPV